MNEETKSEVMRALKDLLMDLDYKIAGVRIAGRNTTVFRNQNHIITIIEEND